MLIKWNVIIIIVLAIDVGMGKIYERCEFARELYKVHKFPQEQIAKWVCIVSDISSFDTSTNVRISDRIREHGIFKLSDEVWCSRNTTDMDRTCGDCSLSCGDCEPFEDDDITDDVACAQHVYRVTASWAGKLGGFHAWYFVKKCNGDLTGYTRGCFDDEPSFTSSTQGTTLATTSTTATTTTSTTTQMTAIQPESRIYERCELARELARKHNVPVNEVGDWVCVALYTSGLETSYRTDYASGLFRIQNSWCAPNGNCKLESCDKLLDNDLSDDVACMRRILQTFEFSEFWGEYDRYNCAGKSRQLMQDCFGLLSLVHFS